MFLCFLKNVGAFVGAFGVNFFLKPPFCCIFANKGNNIT